MGLEHGGGHYLVPWGAVLGLSLFPVGFLFQALNKANRSNRNSSMPL